MALDNQSGITRRELSDELLLLLNAGGSLQRKPFSVTTTVDKQKEIPIPSDVNLELYRFELRVGGVPFSDNRFTVDKVNRKIILKSDEEGIKKGRRVDFICYWNTMNAPDYDLLNNQIFKGIRENDNTYRVTLQSSIPVEYRNGLRFVMIPDSNSTGNVSIKVNGLNAIPLLDSMKNNMRNLLADVPYDIMMSNNKFYLMNEYAGEVKNFLDDKVY